MFNAGWTWRRVSLLFWHQLFMEVTLGHVAYHRHGDGTFTHPVAIATGLEQHLLVVVQDVCQGQGQTDLNIL